MPTISPLSQVHPKAELADDVVVGPFCLVGPDAVVGPGTRLLSHVVLVGHTRLGRNNILHPNCVVGGEPQDLKYRGGPTRLEIGDDNVIRECATLHVGTELGGGVTRLGNGNLIMVNAHLAHDCNFGNNCIVANNVAVAGHVVCGNSVAMMGHVGIHHYVTIGDFAYLGGGARIRHDVPPYVKVADDDEVRGLNTTGLRRAGLSDKEISELDEAVRRLFYGRDKPMAVVLEEFDTANGLPPRVRELIDFMRRRTSSRFGRHLETARPDPIAPRN
jgi:UDP-N-acetylglucosamine acyltransferase